MPHTIVPTPVSRVSPVASLLSWLHVAAAIACAAYVTSQAPALKLPPLNATPGVGWMALWAVALVVCGAAPWRPMAGLLSFVILCYAVPRYELAYLGMLRLHVLNYAAALAMTGWIVSCMRSARHSADGDRPVERDNHRSFPWLHALMFAFVGWLVVCGFVAVLRGHPWDPHHNHHPERFGHALVVFILASQLLRSPRAAVAFCFTLGAALIARWIISADVKLEGDVSALSVMAMPLMFLGFQACGEKEASSAPPDSAQRRGEGNASGVILLRLAFTGMLIALVVLLSLTRNRNAAVAFAVMLPALWIASLKKGRALAAGLPVVLLIGSLFVGSAYFERFRALITGSNDANSAKHRLIIWNAAWKMALANPVMGVGTGNFHNVVGRYGSASATTGKTGLEDDEYAAHNSVIHVLGETGFPGGALYIAIFGGAVIAAGAAARGRGAAWPGPAGRMLFVALCVYLSIGLFISRHDMSLGYLLAGWAAGLRSAGSIVPADQTQVRYPRPAP